MEKKYKRPEKARIDPERVSTCHPAVEWAKAPIFTINRDGSETHVGVAKYCPCSDWAFRRKQECFQILGLEVRRAAWPSDLPTEQFKDLVGRHGPGHWIRSGFHLARHRGEWSSLNHIELNGVPPFLEDVELCPSAKQILDFRRTRARRARRDPEPAPAPRDRMQQAAGEGAEEPEKLSSDPF